ncbi:MAG: Ig-like domain-containing protein [Lachnospiraceae bacterium]|nr:Ig-like domain-containing protein [Lachnospiraceae bacterium]
MKTQGIFLQKITKNQRRRGKILSIVLAHLLILSSLFIQPTPSSQAATEVTVYITEGILNHAVNRTMSVGETRAGWGIELNKNRKVKSAVWGTSNTEIATVTGNNSGAVVTAHKEGTAKLKLTVVTDENETVSTECLISSVTVIEADKQPTGYVKKTANFYRGASTEVKVRNTGQAGQKLTVIALCEDFYRVRLPDDYEFGDELNQATTYARKQDIEIPVTDLSITGAEEADTIKLGGSLQLKAVTKPELATRKEILWSSSNDSIASVSAEGKVTARKTGTVEITAKEKYTGISASCGLRIVRDTPVSSPAAKRKLKLEKDSDFRGNYVGWEKFTDASYYQLYIGTWKEKRKKVVYKSVKTTQTFYYDTNIKKGLVYHYYLKAYSQAGKCLDTSRKIKIKATAPELTAEPVSLTSIRLNWKPEKSRHIKGIQGYRIYRSSQKKGKYKCIKQIKKKKTFQWSDTKRKSETTYYYKICAYQKKKKKTKNGAKSEVVMAKTYGMASEATNWNYFYSMKDKWNGVCMEQEKVTEAQSIQRMNDYSVYQNEETTYPYIKYHLTTDTLYIHVYVEYLSYKEVDGEAVRTAPPSQKLSYEGKEQGKTYREEFIDGITYAYNIHVQGNGEDFAPGVNFQTKLVLHERGTETVHANQRFLEVRIGGVCPDCQWYKTYWFHGNEMGVGDTGVEGHHLYLSINEELGHQEMPQSFRSVVSHELGHVLGLCDGYGVELANGEIIDRMRENDETCIQMSADDWKSIMKTSREKIKMKANDIEMMLLAYGHSVSENEIDVSQAYQDYNYQGHYETSEAIINRKDGYVENENRK